MAKRSSWGSIERYALPSDPETGSSARGPRPCTERNRMRRQDLPSLGTARSIYLADVARLLGHTTPVNMCQHYDRPSAEQLAGIVPVLGGMVRGPKETKGHAGRKEKRCTICPHVRPFGSIPGGHARVFRSPFQAFSRHLCINCALICAHLTKTKQVRNA